VTQKFETRKQSHSKHSVNFSAKYNKTLLHTVH